MKKEIKQIFITVFLVFIISGFSLGIAIFLQNMLEDSVNLSPFLIFFLLIITGSILLVRWNEYQKTRKSFSMSEYRRALPTILTDAFANRKKEEKQLRKALNHMENREYEQAIEILMRMESLCEHTKESFVIFFLQAQCFYYRHQYREALILYSRALEERAVYPAANKKAECLQMLGDPEAALHAYHDAAELEPKIAEPCMQIAYICCHMQRYEEALDWIDEALAREPDNAFAYMLACECYLMLDNHEAVEEAFHAACDCGADSELLEESLHTLIVQMNEKTKKE